MHLWFDIGIVPITLLVADDSDVARQAIKHSLEEEPNIQLVAEATNFADIVRMAAEPKPDVVLVGLHMRNAGV
jgi:chemotaxis response regulator CheB